MKTTTFLKVMENRFQGTRKMIAAVPSEKLDFRPTPDMRSARELALHLMGNYSFLLAGMAENNWSLEAFQTNGEHLTTNDLVSNFDALYKTAKEKLRSFPDQAFDLRVKPFGVEQKISTIVQGVAEHEIHHRGQLSVYLRLMGIKPPELHGE
jgi:uncharacterized damage-inducible protein DinB